MTNADLTNYMRRQLMKLTRKTVALLLAYCTPFAFLAMNEDLQSGSLYFYLFMLISFLVLCFTAVKSDNSQVLFPGNLLSFISSYIFIQLFNLNEESYYFKPFTAVGLLVAVTIIMCVLQLGIIRIVKKMNRV